jgi:hypothetical protein
MYYRCSSNAPQQTAAIYTRGVDDHPCQASANFLHLDFAVPCTAKPTIGWIRGAFSTQIKEGHDNELATRAACFTQYRVKAAKESVEMMTTYIDGGISRRVLCFRTTTRCK